MFSLGKPEPHQGRYTSIKDTLIEFRDLYKFDVIKAICFCQSNSQVYVVIRSEKVGQTEKMEHNYLLSIEVDKSFLGLMLKEKKILFKHPEEDDGHQGYVPLNKNATTEVYCPLYYAETNEVFGCIYLGSRNNVRIDWDEFVNDYRLAVLNGINSVVDKDTKQSNYLLSGLRILNEFLAKYNPYLLNHHFNVAYLSNRIANELQMQPLDKMTLYYASLLHDVGNLHINGNILNKKGKLTDSEYRIIKNHVIYSANLARQILEGMSNKEMIVKIIMQHHEMYDGKGYPHGLMGEEIDIKSRIVCVADAVEAMLSGRSYRTAMSIDHVIGEVKAKKGTHFDPQVVDAVIRILYERTYTKSMIQEIPIMAATLSVYTSDDCFIIPGILINKETWYEFHPDYTSDLDIIEWIKASQITLSFVANREIFEYEAQLLKINEGVVYLSQLEVKSTMTSYSLYWEIQGSFYLNRATTIPITTTRISGDALVFVAQPGANDIEKNKLYKLCLNFSNNDLEYITGVVTQQYNTGHGLLHFFKYHNVPDSLKDRIIGRIFKKQLEFKHRLYLALS